MRKASKMQLNAINHVKGPARVIAGPGSGKTFTIVQRIISLIVNHHVNPDQILTITFTKAAALEMQSRYLKESKDNPIISTKKESVHFGTFHGICYTILKESGLFSKFTLVKETDKRKIIETILKNKGVTGAEEYDISSGVLDMISRKKNFCEISQLPPGLSGEVFEEICLDYDDMMNQQKFLDFDDMILLCLRQLQSNGKLREKWQHRFTHIQVDEFQDINEVQYQVVKILAAGYGNLFVVGDDDQSIYGFRGSAPGIMQKFSKDFENVKELFLTENYRSGSEIVHFADRVIISNKNRFLKSPVPMKKGGKVSLCFLTTRQEEERRILKDIKMLSIEQQKNSALIVRTNAEAYRYLELLKHDGINVHEQVKQKEDRFQSFVASDFQAFLRFCREGNRRSDFLMIMNKPNLFLSRQSLTREVITENDILEYYRNNREMCQKVKLLFHHFAVASTLSPFLAVRYFRKVMGYDEYLVQKSIPENRESFLGIAERLTDDLKQMKTGETTAEFFNRMQNSHENEKLSLTEGISVITMHGAKGLEFDCVFLPDLNEGVIPGKNSKTEEEVEEERRLLYVAITRAQNLLYLYYTNERNRKITRFLRGITVHQC